MLFRILISFFKASRGAVPQSVTLKPTGCGFDPRSRRWNIYLNLYFRFFALVSRTSAALSSATQHAMPPEFGKKWEMECLNTRFPLPTLLCAGYGVKLILIFKIIYFTIFDRSGSQCGPNKRVLNETFKHVDIADVREVPREVIFIFYIFVSRHFIHY